MNVKKKPGLDLEKRKSLFLNLGLLVAGSLTLAAFKYGTPIEKKSQKDFDKPLVAAELFEAVKTVPPKTASVRPPAPQVFTPEIVDEKQKEPEDNWVNQVQDELPDFVDFNDGEVGMGDFGTGDADVIETMGIEFVQELPEFPGGDPAMMSFVQSGFKFPKFMDTYEQGTIYVKFIVNHKGEVEDPKIERGISPELDKEALRVVKSMPDWKPGKHRGRPVNVSMIIPIRIKVQ